MNKFKSEAYAKCILAGEHSVLRGGAAIVAPVKSCALISEWDLVDQPLQIDFGGKFGRELSLVFGGALDQACLHLGVGREGLVGKWSLHNHIQVGGGLGASAAICVTIARYLVTLGKLLESEIYEFSRSLENLFHGESSGVDIAATMAKGPLLFSRETKIKSQNLESLWSPQLFVSYSGHKGVTSECVEIVKKFIARDPRRGLLVDSKMAEAVELAKKSLDLGEKMGFNLMADAISLAHSCFEEWGLVDLEMKSEIQKLKSLGAVAVKPTGSGRGGYLLSLWKSAPTSAQLFDLHLVELQ